MSRAFACACVLGVMAIGACTGTDPTREIAAAADGGSSASGAGEDAATSADGGTDAATDVVCLPSDAGPLSPSGSTGVECGDRTCNQEACCLDEKTSAPSCASNVPATCASGSVTWACDDMTDCGTSLCFAELSPLGCGVYAIGNQGSACAPSAPPPGAVQLCSTDDECAQGGKCLVATATRAAVTPGGTGFSTVIGVCSP